MRYRIETSDELAPLFLRHVKKAASKLLAELRRDAEISASSGRYTLEKSYRVDIPEELRWFIPHCGAAKRPSLFVKTCMWNEGNFRSAVAFYV